MILQESQTVEFKESWRDEFLKTVCAFANTDGGTLYIGVNDKGAVKIYQEINSVSKPTATRDLQNLISLKVIEMTGTAGENIKYILVGS